MKVNIVPGTNIAPMTAKDQLIELVPQIVNQPSFTRVVRTETPSGKVRFLVVDHRLIPNKGNLVICTGDDGRHELLRYRQTTPLDRVWGTVVWCLQEA